MQIYLKPLRKRVVSGKEIIKQEDINYIFSNIEAIFLLHSQALGNFSDLIENHWPFTGHIGEVSPSLFISLPSSLHCPSSIPYYFSFYLPSSGPFPVFSIVLPYLWPFQIPSSLLYFLFFLLPIFLCGLFVLQKKRETNIKGGEIDSTGNEKGI